MNRAKVTAIPVKGYLGTTWKWSVWYSWGGRPWEWFITTPSWQDAMYIAREHLKYVKEKYDS